MTPYQTDDILEGDTPSVLALSWGKGDPQKDAIHVVVLDEEGRLRDHLKLDNLLDEKLIESFTDLVKRRDPDVVVVGGFTVRTKGLRDQLAWLLNGETPEPIDDVPTANPPNGSATSSSQPNGHGPAPAAPSDWAGAGGWNDATSGNTNSGAGFDNANTQDTLPSSSSVATAGWGNSNDSAPTNWGGSGWGDTANNAPGEWNAQSSSSNNPGTNQADANPWGTLAQQQDPPQANTSSPERPRSSQDKGKDKDKKIPIIYVNDEVARIYQHSKRAEEEYGRLPLIARYCVGLARYVQSPLNEYAALGADLPAIMFDEAQNLVSVLQVASPRQLLTQGHIGSPRQTARCSGTCPRQHRQHRGGRHQSCGRRFLLSEPAALCLRNGSSESPADGSKDISTCEGFPHSNHRYTPDVLLVGRHYSQSDTVHQRRPHGKQHLPQLRRLPPDLERFELPQVFFEEAQSE